MEIYQNLSLESLPNEEWRDVIGYEGLYQVSNLGRVKSLERCINRGSGVYKRSKIILRPQINGTGHLHVCLFDISGKRKIKPIHQMVLASFSDNKYNRNCIDHIDGNPLNNRLSNLKYCTQQENMNNPITKEKIRKGLEKVVNSIEYIEKQRHSQPHSKKVVQIDIDGSEKEYKTISEAARSVGCTVQAISQCCHGKCETSKGYKWKFN